MAGAGPCPDSPRTCPALPGAATDVARLLLALADHPDPAGPID
ncbi:MAG TPA: hypothetical protein VLJ59_12630 [Mycobacteriales bacterium]|nr:hypothetical protein [Mycobacteriales bacterium]